MEPTPHTPPPEAAFDAAWRDHHRHLENLATRMLGDRAAAEDITQDAFGRLMAADMDRIRDVRGWLTVVVRRLCLNRLRSAYSRRESATDSTPLEQAVVPTSATTRPPVGRDVGSDPADRLTLDDQVRTALSVLLDELTPAERTAFLLHDVFALPHAAVGQIVGRSPAACRQLASRARRAVRAAGPRQDRPVQLSSDEARVVDQFLTACTNGDLDGLVALLDPDITGEAVTADGGHLGHFGGRRAVAGNTMIRFGPGTGARLVRVPVEQRPGAVVMMGDEVHAIVAFDVLDGLIRHIRAVATGPIE